MTLCRFRPLLRRKPLTAEHSPPGAACAREAPLHRPDRRERLPGADAFPPSCHKRLSERRESLRERLSDFRAPLRERLSERHERLPSRRTASNPKTIEPSMPAMKIGHHGQKARFAG